MATPTRVDPNMEFARLFAEGLGQAPALPASLNAIEARARLVDQVDGSMIHSADLFQIAHTVAAQVRRVVEGSATLMADTPDPLVRLNVVLRLWAGCISGAKIIAHETRSGPNTPQYRGDATTIVEGYADRDPIFAAGLEAAPAFKRFRDQTYLLEGVPERSRLRLDA